MKPEPTVLIHSLHIYAQSTFLEQNRKCSSTEPCPPIHFNEIQHRSPGGDSKSSRFHHVNSPLIWLPMQWHKQEPLHFWVATKMDVDWKESLVVDSGVKRVLLAFQRQRASDGIKVVVLLVVDLLFSHK